MAWIVPTTDAPSLDELRKLVADTIAPWAAPKELVIVDDLPRTASGKVRRRALFLSAPGRPLSRSRATTRLRRSSFSGLLTTRTPTIPPSRMSSTNMDTIRPPSTNTVAGCPLRTTACGTPSTFFATCSRNREAWKGPTTGASPPGPCRPVGPDHDVLRQHRQEAREVTRRARHQEAVRELAAVFQVGVEALPPSFDVPAGPGAQLAARTRGCGRANPRDLLERIAEDVMQEIRRPLERPQLLEQHQERQRQAVGLRRPPRRRRTTTGSGSHAPAYVLPLVPAESIWSRHSRVTMVTR